MCHPQSLGGVDIVRLNMSNEQGIMLEEVAVDCRNDVTASN